MKGCGTINGISTLAEWICHDHGRDLCPEVREHIDLILNRTRRMHELIEGLLEYSQLKPIPEKVTSVSVDALVKRLMDDINPTEIITVTIENKLPVIRCEQDTVTRIFRHLLDNAIRFMHKPQGQITIGCTEHPDRWEFHVTDNGPGIEEKYFDKIFRMFQTLEQWEQSHTTGIGLPLVKKAVEMHGGEIWVESEVGEGTTFHFTLLKQAEDPRSVSHHFASQST